MRMMTKGHGLGTLYGAIATASVLCALACGCLTIAMPQALRVQPRYLRSRPELICAFCTLTVGATPASVNFTLTKGGISAGSVPVVITTTMNGVSVLGSLSLYGYFNSATAALTDGASTPHKIPTSSVFGQMTTGVPTSFTAFTQSNALGPAGAGLLLFSSSSLLSLGCLPITASCRTDSLSLEIDLTALPQQPAGTYTGTLTLQAQAL